MGGGAAAGPRAVRVWPKKVGQKASPTASNISMDAMRSYVPVSSR